MEFVLLNVEASGLKAAIDVSNTFVQKPPLPTPIGVMPLLVELAEVNICTVVSSLVVRWMVFKHVNILSTAISTSCADTT